MVTTCNGGGWIVVDNDDDNQEPQTNGCEIFIGASIVKPKDKPIDRNHPHQCFRCKRTLKFSELIKRNLTYIYYWWIDPDGRIRDIEFYSNEHYQQYKHFKKLWKNKYVQFYCCTCYQTIKGTL